MSGETSARERPRALVVYGGWDGHQPEAVAQILSRVLREGGFDVETSDTLDAFRDEGLLRSLSLIVPHWTMGTITNDQLRPVLNAVQAGVGIAGCHGGMCDAFRDTTDWHFMTGGQWVAHPGNDGTRYRVNVGPARSPITQGVGDFDVVSEQYYMHVDPSNEVLATTKFSGEHAYWIDGVTMPVVWKRKHGEGRVFYSSLGHQAREFEVPEMRTLFQRGALWAAREAS